MHYALTALPLRATLTSLNLERMANITNGPIHMVAGTFNPGPGGRQRADLVSAPFPRPGHPGSAGRGRGRRGRPADLSHRAGPQPGPQYRALRGRAAGPDLPAL